MQIQLPDAMVGNARLSLIELCQTNKHHFIDIPGSAEVHWMEQDKTLSYPIFAAHDIKIPKSVVYNNIVQLLAASAAYPYVIKFDTLASGLQTQIIRSLEDLKHLYTFCNRQSDSTVKVLLQEFIPDSREYTVLVLMNKCNWQTVGTASDYKTLLDNNQGLNTDGMGSISPGRTLHSATDATIDKIVNAIRSVTDYIGCISCQFLIDKEENLWFLEANFRFCDPETQSIVERLDESFADRLIECYSDTFIQPIVIAATNAVTVVLRPKTWPDLCSRSMVPTMSLTKFKIFNSVLPSPNEHLFGSATITNSGLESHAQLAQEIYNYIDTIDTQHVQFRTDIGQ